MQHRALHSVRLPRIARPSALALLLLLAPSLAVAQAPGGAAGGAPTAPDWSIRLGAGVGALPRYPGARDYRAVPLPDVDITYRGTIFLNGRNGFGVNAYRDRLITLGASIWMRGGRDEDDGDRLRGLGDIDTAAQARVFGRIAIGRAQLGATLARDLGGSDGFTVDLNLSADFRPFERLTISPGIGTTIGDNRYVQTWFGVTPAQAARSTLPAYDAGAGFVSVAGFVRATYALTDHWSVGSIVAVQRLLGDAADSPIVERRTSPTGILSLSYRF